MNSLCRMTAHWVGVLLVMFMVAACASGEEAEIRKALSCPDCSFIEGAGKTWVQKIKGDPKIYTLKESSRNDKTIVLVDESRKATFTLSVSSGIASSPQMDFKTKGEWKKIELKAKGPPLPVVTAPSPKSPPAARTSSGAAGAKSKATTNYKPYAFFPPVNMSVGNGNPIEILKGAEKDFEKRGPKDGDIFSKMDFYPGDRVARLEVVLSVWSGTIVEKLPNNRFKVRIDKSASKRYRVGSEITVTRYEICPLLP